jgi:hypothetical protein
LFVPEGHLHYRWDLGRVTLFAGGGLRAARVHSNFRSDYSTDWDLTMSVAGGTGVRLTEQLGLIGELRVRGIEWDFPGKFPRKYGRVVARSRLEASGVLDATFYTRLTVST